MDLTGVDPAGAAAIGCEALVRGTYSLGVQARIASTIDLDHTSFAQLLVELSFY